MATIIQEFSLDLFPGERPPKVKVSQYDSGTSRVLRAYLYVDGEPFIVNAGTMATVEGTNEEGTTYKEVCTMSGATAVPGYVEFPLTDAMTSIEGKVRSKVTIRTNGTIIGTGSFILFVDAAAVTPDAVINETGFVDDIAQALAQVLSGEDYVSDAVTAWLDDHPEATTTVEDDSITFDKLAFGDDLQDSMALAEMLQRKVAGMTVGARRIFMLRREIRGGIYRAPWIGSDAMFESGIANDLNELDDPKFNKRLVVVRYYAPPADGTDDGGSGADDSGEDSEDTGGGGTTPSGGDETSDDDSTDVYAYTQNTPCRAELPDGTYATTWRRGVCISFISGSAGTQIAFPSGSVNICRRHRRDGVWGAWTRAVMYGEYKALVDRVAALEGN